QPGSTQNQLIQQPYPFGAATQQPVPTPYTANANQPYYQAGYQTVPAGNPALTSNGYPTTQYPPAGYLTR
ncbi:MAG: hypothetical protein VB862_06995, partial [Pirellulaceae bacterium]